MSDAAAPPLMSDAAALLHMSDAAAPCVLPIHTSHLLLCWAAGYYVVDKASTASKPVFNQVVALRESASTSKGKKKS